MGMAVPSAGCGLTAGDPDGFGTGEECSYAARSMCRLALKISSSSAAPLKFLIPPLACALNRTGRPRQTVGLLARVHLTARRRRGVAGLGSRAAEPPPT
jgi:hypothetical protein